MYKLKKLVGETAIYGVSSILGRIINYLLIPLHTSVFLPHDMGSVTKLYAYSAVFLILYTFGMETTFFRFAKNEPQKTFNTAITIIIIISSFLSSCIFLFAENIANLISFQSEIQYIQLLSVIIWIDAVTSIAFAALRNENKAGKFTGIKLISILSNVSIQFILLKTNVIYFIGLTQTIGIIFWGNLIANLIIIPLLYSEFSRFKITFDKKVMTQMLKYATPIAIMGIVGMLIEQIDKIILEWLIPTGFYKGLDGAATLGVYGQLFKISVFMMLAIQAFRYAGEPFFFSNSNEKNSPLLFAKVMHYFIILTLLIFVLVSINIDFIIFIFFQNDVYKVGLYIIPFILFAKIIYGIYINLSVWYKLLNKTIYGLYFGVIGLIISLISNLILIPLIGMLGCAIAMICCYTAMCLSCYYVGKKHLLIPYKFLQLWPYFTTSIILVLISFQFQHTIFWIDTTINFVISIVVIYLLYLFEKKSIPNQYYSY